jgi:hypothetical protein
MVLNTFSVTAYNDFVTGPTTGRKFFKDGRKAIQSDRGPYMYPLFLSFTDLLQSLLTFIYLQGTQQLSIFSP